jgi:hypothetical protein
MSPRSFFHHDNSFFLDQFDPLIKGTSTPSDVLLDLYIAYREDVGRPITHRELTDAARYAAGMGGYGRKVAEAIGGRGRAEWGGSPRSMTKRNPSVP